MTRIPLNNRMAGTPGKASLLFLTDFSTNNALTFAILKKMYLFCLLETDATNECVRAASSRPVRPGTHETPITIFT